MVRFPRPRGRQRSRQIAPSWGAPTAADCTPHGSLCAPAEPALVLT
jgi:hypothetical protein